jgi:hypothetical protein
MSYLPNSITGCQLWLDGSDASSLVLSGSNVTTWNDKSGNNYHMNTLTAKADWSGNAEYPTIGTSINGLQTVNFTPQAGLRQSTTLDGVKNLFWVGRIAAPTGSGGIHNSYFFLGHESAIDWHGLAYGQKFLDPAIATSGILNASPTSLFTPDSNAITNTTFANVFKPTAPNVSILSVAGITGSTRYQGLCFDRVYHFGWCGDLAEVIIYSTALTTDQRQTTETYLARKWGLTDYLPVGHPGFVYIPPRQKLLSVPKTIVISNSIYLPTSIAGCQMWLDGNDPLGTGTQPANEATVSTWVDKSVNGFNATAAPSRVAGTYSTSLKAVNFPNSNTGYITNYSASPTNETMFVVFNNATASYSNNILIGGVSGARSLGAGYSGSGGQTLGVVGNLNTQLAWLARTDAGSYILGTTAIVTSQFTSSSNSISLNGGTTSTGGAPGFTAGRVTYLGVDATVSSFYYIGYAMEIIFYNSILTTAQRQEVEGYLAQKWNITSSLAVGHPGRTTQVYQTAVTVTQPTTTTVTYLPTSIAGCQLWLDGLDPAGTGVQPSNGDTVSTWVDKATGKNATATGTSTYLSGGGVNFTGTSYFLNQTFSQNLSQRSIFIVFQETTTSYNAGVIVFIPTPNSGDDSGSTSGLTSEIGFPNSLWFYGNSDSYRSMLGGSHPLPRGIYHDSMNGTTGSGYLNGSNATNVNAGYTAGTCSGYALGGRWQQGSMSASYRQNGVIYEILYFNSVLTTTQRQEIESYLAQKWTLTASLPVGHPGLTTSVYQVTVPLPRQKLRIIPGISSITTTYSPSSIAGCQLWLDAADSASMTIAAEKVSQWRDKSGSNNHATSPSSIRDATLTANALNGRSVMTFLGSQNFTGPISIGTTFTQFILYFNSSGRIGQGLMDSNDAGILGKLAFQEGGSECFQSGFGFSFQRFFRTGGSYRILMTKCSNPSSSATVSHWFNGTDQNIGTGIWSFYGANTTPITSITIAARGDSIYFIGTIAEIIIYNSAISLSDQRQVEAYLAQKWGLTASLPAGHVGLTSSVYEVSVPLPKQKIRSIIP